MIKSSFSLWRKPRVVELASLPFVGLGIPRRPIAAPWLHFRRADVARVAQVATEPYGELFACLEQKLGHLRHCWWTMLFSQYWEAPQKPYPSLGFRFRGFPFLCLSSPSSSSPCCASSFSHGNFWRDQHFRLVSHCVVWEQPFHAETRKNVCSHFVPSRSSHFARTPILFDLLVWPKIGCRTLAPGAGYGPILLFPRIDWFFGASEIW